MRTFFKDMMTVQKESNALSKAFIKKHPVGYVVFVVTCGAVSASPIIYHAVKDKFTEKKLEKKIKEIEDSNQNN